MEPKGKASFEVEGKGDFYNVYFAVDRRKELQVSFSSAKDEYAIHLKQENGDGFLQSSGGGGAPFQPDNGKIDLELINHSDLKLKILIFVNK